MSAPAPGLYKVGGYALVVSGALFFVGHGLNLMAGSPPSGADDMLAWVASSRSLLAWANEILFFAVMFLVPGVIALHHSVARSAPTAAAIGCGVIAALIPTLMVLVVVQGRLVFPVYGIELENESAALVVTVFHGGLHAVDELFGVATIVLGLAMRRHHPFGKPIAYLAFAAAAGDFAAAYAWLIAPAVVVMSRLLFTVWFVALGISLLHDSRRHAAELPDPSGAH